MLLIFFVTCKHHSNISQIQAIFYLCDKVRQIFYPSVFSSTFVCVTSNKLSRRMGLFQHYFRPRAQVFMFIVGFSSTFDLPKPPDFKRSWVKTDVVYRPTRAPEETDPGSDSTGSHILAIWCFPVSRA